MKKLVPLVLVAALAACGQEQSETTTSTGPALETQETIAAYSFGYKLGNQIHQQLEGLDADSFVAGLSEGIRGPAAQAALSQDEMDEAMQQYQIDAMNRAQQQSAQQSAANKAAGDNYRAENAQREGVVALDNGLQYEVLESGSGDTHPTLDDEVKAHYHGELVDGTVFDSSVDRGEPATFPLAHVIEGWQEAVSKMVVGDKWRLVIPPELGYGDQAGGPIPPGSTLIFEVELLEINPEG